jgi:hypothetical protein
MRASSKVAKFGKQLLEKKGDNAILLKIERQTSKLANRMTRLTKHFSLKQ